MRDAFFSQSLGEISDNPVWIEASLHCSAVCSVSKKKEGGGRGSGTVRHRPLLNAGYIKAKNTMPYRSKCFFDLREKKGVFDFC